MAQEISTQCEQQVAEEQLKESSCVHYWAIEPPNGPVSKGICKRCGAVKEFYNDAQRLPSNVS